MIQLSTIDAAERLTATVEQLSAADTLSRVTEIVTASVRALLGADGATFVLRRDERCHYVDEDAISPLWRGRDFAMSECVSGWAMLHGEVVVIPDIYDDERVPLDAYRPTFVTSLAMAPVRRRDPIAAIGAYFAERHEPTPAELRLLEMLADSAAVAWENLELRGAVGRRSHELDEAEARRDELEAAMHTLVHDLRGPLGTMLGYAELIEDVVDDDPDKARVFAATVQESGHRMAERIDRMLSLYRLSSRPVAPETVDLTALARDVGETLIAAVPQRDVRLSVDDGLTVHADPALTRLLLENLLGNAVKYTAREERAEISLIDAGSQGPLTRFTVRDNGAGFDAAEAHRLFRPMVRLHADDDFPGTGLGLASVARIADLHHGSVAAHGEPTVGAEFTVTLPRTPA